MTKTNLLLVLIAFAINFSLCFSFDLGLCYSQCNTLWVACVSAAGAVTVMTTGDVAVPAAVQACNVGQGVCMSGCTAG